MYFTKEEKEVRTLSGANLFDSRIALMWCDGDIEVAVEFLKLKGQAFARPFKESDYVALAKANLGRTQDDH